MSNTTNETEEISHDTGVFSSHQKGFGFINPDDGSESIFVAARNKNTAFHKDRVRFEIINPGTENTNREAIIKEILERSITEIVGTYSASDKFGFVKPDIKNISQDIFIPGKKSMHAKNNDKVLVRISSYGSNDKRPDGEIIEILGQKDAPGVDVLSIIKSKSVPVDFPEEALEEADKLPSKVSTKDLKNREDLRNILTVTIDGEETKDFDDALSLTIEGDIYHVGVHIADVTHYVKEDEAIDKEARFRGTSVYPTDRVVPMIPLKLSEGICSLVENSDRLTLSCLMDFDSKGNLLSRRICETVINVDRRMTYTEVSAMLENPSQYMSDDSADILSMITNVKKLTDIFREKKTKRGAVDFDFDEPEIILDENGHPIDIYKRKRDDATRIIEELMLKTNETVAETISLDKDFKGVPLIFRSHDTPDEDRIDYLKKLVQSLGHSFNVKPENVKPSDIQKLIHEVKGSKEELLITTMTLRCMKRAMYSTASVIKNKDDDSISLQPNPHFGIAASYYCHFTSPIRRYSDLTNHRIIKKALHGQLDDEKKKKYMATLPDLAQHLCETEHRAIDTERDANRIKMAEYMKERVGEVFDGVISGMASWGIYVSLPNVIEGLVPLSSLNDGYYVFDEEHMVMSRETGGREFHIGDNVRVRVTEADTDLRIIDFEFV